MAIGTQKNNLRQEVALINVRFYAYHGFYPEEQVLGHEFFVDVKLGFVPRKTAELPPDGAAVSDPFDQTINYEHVFQLVAKEMSEPRQLLETVCEGILHALLAEYSFLHDARVEIRKSNPPFGGDQAVSSVSLNWSNR